MKIRFTPSARAQFLSLSQMIPYGSLQCGMAHSFQRNQCFKHCSGARRIKGARCASMHAVPLLKGLRPQACSSSPPKADAPKTSPQATCSSSEATFCRSILKAVRPLLKRSALSSCALLIQGRFSRSFRSLWRPAASLFAFKFSRLMKLTWMPSMVSTMRCS